MKKKIYFIISSILQLIGALYIIINANDIIQLQLEMVSETYAMFPVDFQQRMVDMLENGGVAIMIATSIFQIILNLFVIKFAVKNSIVENKGKLIAISLLCFFTAESSIVTLLSVVNFLVLLFIKNTAKKEKSKIPEIEYQKPSKSEIISGIVLVLVYFSQILLGVIVPDNISQIVAIIVQIIYDILILAVAIICFKDRLKRDIKLFKDNAKVYLKYILPRLGIMYVAVIISNLICIFITGQATSMNQSTLETLPLWYMAPTAIIWAPIVEELIFRGVLRRFIKNNKLFIITSAIIFGVLHSMSEATIFNVIIVAIPYAVVGGFFAHIYAKTNNITTNILMHAFQNTIATLLSATTLFII